MPDQSHDDEAIVPTSDVNGKKTREELLEWILLFASEDDVRWLLGRMATKYRSLMQAAVEAPEVTLEAIGLRPQEAKDIPEKIESPIISGGESEDDEPSPLRRGHSNDDIIKEDFSKAYALAPEVQFASARYFCNHDEDSCIVVDIMRIGNLSQASCISFRTIEGSAKAGVKFEYTSGKVNFDVGSNSEEIKIKLVGGNHWDTTTEFKVELVEDADTVNCFCGRYLHTARVRVINNHAFPSDKYRAAIKSGNRAGMPFWPMFWEYCKLNYSFPLVKRGTRKKMAVHFVHSVVFFINLGINVYLVDEVLKDVSAPTDTKRKKLVALACVALLPMFLLHVLDLFETTWKVNGGSRALLQLAMLRKFLNYSENVREDLKSADLIMGVTRDVPLLVIEGYAGMISLADRFVELWFIFIFQLIAPLIFPSAEFHPMGVAILFIYPMFLVTSLFLRHGKTSRAIEKRDEKQDELVQTLSRTIANYRLIADFQQRPFFEDRFGKEVGEFNKLETAKAQVLRNNKYVGEWLTKIVISFYILIGGMHVVSDKLSLGMFLANLHLIRSMGKCWTNIYLTLLGIESTAPAFYTIVELINFPTDLNHRKELNDVMRSKTKQLRAELQGVRGDIFPADALPIVCENLHYDVAVAKAAHTEGVHVLVEDGLGSEPAFSMQGEMHFKQGALIAFVGPQGTGKSTLLKVIGGVILPSPGQLFVPSHLRVLHVGAESLFFKSSLYDNLTFGCAANDADASVERVCKICKSLGVHEKMISFLKEGKDGKQLNWSDVISHSHKSLLCLARAIITNPEVLCLRDPFVSHSDKIGKKIKRVLNEFVANKGVEQDASSRHSRRPRTCMYTARKLDALYQADDVYHVSKNDGIRRVSIPPAEALVSNGGKDYSRVLVKL